MNKKGGDRKECPEGIDEQKARGKKYQNKEKRRKIPLGQSGLRAGGKGKKYN